MVNLGKSIQKEQNEGFRDTLCRTVVNDGTSPE